MIWIKEVLNREQSMERCRNSPDSAGLVQEQPRARSKSAKNASETTALHTPGMSQSVLSVLWKEEMD